MRAVDELSLCGVIGVVLNGNLAEASANGLGERDRDSVGNVAGVRCRRRNSGGVEWGSGGARWVIEGKHRLGGRGGWAGGR